MEIAKNKKIIFQSIKTKNKILGKIDKLAGLPKLSVDARLKAKNKVKIERTE